jgi:hypothetical protein
VHADEGQYVPAGNAWWCGLSSSVRISIAFRPPMKKKSPMPTGTGSDDLVVGAEAEVAASSRGLLLASATAGSRATVATRIVEEAEADEEAEDAADVGAGRRDSSL